MVVKTSDLTPAMTSEIGDDVEGDPKMKVEIGAVTGVMKSEVSGGGAHRSEVSVEDPNIGWGRWYSMKEVELATRGFAEGNVIGEGGYGVVYRGILQDASVVAVKNLLNNKYVTYPHVKTPNFYFFYISILLLNIFFYAYSAACVTLFGLFFTLLCFFQPFFLFHVYKMASTFIL